jgi:hypothetical protein
LGSCSYLLAIWNKQLLNHSRHRRGNRDGSLGGSVGERERREEREREREREREYNAYKMCTFTCIDSNKFCECAFVNLITKIIMMACVVVYERA